MKNKNNNELLYRERKWKRNFPKLARVFNFKKNLKKSRKHLDFGCGFGNFAAILARKYLKIKVYGIDMDKERINAGGKRYRLKNLSFKSGRKTQGKYDTITAIHVIHEMRNPEGKIKEFSRHLNKKGKLFVLEFKKSTRKLFKKHFDKDPYWRGQNFEGEYKEHNRWNLKEFENLCRKAGFKNLKLKKFNDIRLIYIGEKNVTQ